MMRVTLTMSKTRTTEAPDTTFLHAEAAYDINEEKLRQEVLLFLQRLAELHEATVTVAAAGGGSP
jgi:hypothetical protein